MDKKGFTLIELMVTIVILVIIAALSAPQYQATIKRNKDAKIATEGVSLPSTAPETKYYTATVYSADGSVIKVYTITSYENSYDGYELIEEGASEPIMVPKSTIIEPYK